MSKVRKGTPTYIGLKREVTKLNLILQDLRMKKMACNEALQEAKIELASQDATINGLRHDCDQYDEANVKLKQANESLHAQLGLHERIMDWTARLFGKHKDMLPPLIRGSGEHLLVQRLKRDFIRERTSIIPRSREADNFRAQQKAADPEDFKPKGMD